MIQMPPVLRVRDPRLGKSNVSILRGWEAADGQRKKILKIIIRLPTGILSDINTQTKQNHLDSESKDRKNARDDSEDLQDLSSLELELNEALSNTTSVGLDKNKSQEQHTQEATIQTGSIIDSKEKVLKPSAGPEYRSIPSNLTSIITRELADDEELGMISKMIFSLKDPISTIKISLPVKSIFCKHFECFDYETFCQYSNIPSSIRMLTRKNLAKRNFEMKKLEKFHKNGPMNVKELYLKLHPKYYSAPTKKYKCPICDLEFDLGEMIISDAYNFFVKTTPMSVSRVELVDMIKYRILDDVCGSFHSSEPVNEVIVLTDDEEQENEEAKGKENVIDGRNHEQNNLTVCKFKQSNDLDNDIKKIKVKQELKNSKVKQEHYNRQQSDDVFNDGLDEKLLGLNNQRGQGSWEDPVMID